jgi:RNA polymerase sigma-70 factor (ECF subfamily)
MEPPLETDPDLPLLRAYAAGDQRAFTTLCERHGAAIKGFSLRMLHNAQQAEEVYVETFLRIAQSKGRFEERGSVRGYLFTIARRQCIDLLRQRKRSHAATPHLVELEERRPLRPSPEAQLLLNEQASALEKAMNSLPEEHREVVLLRLVHGLSAAETAAALGISEDQVNSQLSYARKRLRALIEEQATLGRRREEK